MNILSPIAIILAVSLASCHSSVDNQYAQQKKSIQPVITDLLLQRELADSSELTHIKGLFYRGPEGHLYERTIADREINGKGPLVAVEYFNGSLPQDIDPLTFEALDGWYAKDKRFAYYYRPTSGGMLTIKLDKADANSFKIFQGHYQYAADKNHVFKNSEILENIKPEKAKVLTDKNGDIISVTSSQGQTIQRKSTETVEQFVARLKPRSHQLAHPVLETMVWGSQKAIITLYGYDNPADTNAGFNRIDGHLYIQTSPGQYRDISFGPIEEDGGYPEVLSVFFANADTDAAKELIILCKYPQQHYDYGGNFYETFIFDNPGQKSNLTYLEKVSKSFYGCECDWRNGKSEVAKYKTAEAVKSGLKNMRF